VRRLIPPVAVPFGVGAIASSVLERAERAAAAFADQLAQRFVAREVALFGSGRAALAAVLAACRRAERDEVLMPAYTCWSVPAAAVRSGCRVRLYDVDPATFLAVEEPWREAGKRVAAVVVADLLSAAPGSDAVLSSIEKHLPESLVVEDRAQSWPARASSRGVTLLSFGRGKPLPLGYGGALLASRRPLDVSGSPSRGAGLRDAAALAATVILGRPGLFRLPASIPMLGVGSTVFDPRFDDARPFREWQGRLGVHLLAGMDELVRGRSRHAAQLAETVAAVPGWKVGPWSDGPLRLPVYAPSRPSRDGAIDVLRGLGVSASTLYPGTLLDIPELREQIAGAAEGFQGAREIADRLLTLPVYPTLTQADIEQIGRAFVAAAREAGR
jgi:dTDP-4-amino-4,6-dideoxygalactose transaminase